MKIIAPKRLMESVFPTVRNGGIFNASSLDLQFARTKTLDSRITFTRASSGTFVGSDGLIKTATTNLLLRSEEFDNASWTAAAATITANTGTSPAGTTTVDTVASTGTAVVSQAITKAASAIAYSGSLFVKGTVTALSLTIDDGATVNRGRVVFNLSTGAISSTNNDGDFTGTSGTITSYANSWYRITVTTTSNSTTSARLRFFWSGSGTSIDVWGAQLEQSSTVGEYIPTTSTINSAPRFDHNPTTGESLGLLVEEQRTNNHLRSEDLANWGTPSAATVSSDATAAPDGTLTADKLVETTSNTAHFLSSSSLSFSYTSGTTYTRSCWLKAAGRTFASLYFPATNFPSTGRTAVFNLTTGVVASAESGVTASITAFPNGWYQCVISRAATTTGSGHSGGTALFSDATTGTYEGDGTSGVFLWGAQLEAGAFPTSYIPTTTTAATRSADVASITGTNFSSWYRQDEGSFYGAFLTPYVAPSTAAQVLFSANDGTGNNFNQIYKRANADTSTRWANNKTGAVDTAFINFGTWTPDLTACAVTYKANDFAATRNGATASTDNTVELATNLTKMEIGSHIDASRLNGTIRRLAYWPQRLSNSTLQQITQ